MKKMLKKIFVSFFFFASIINSSGANKCFNTNKVIVPADSVVLDNSYVRVLHNVSVYGKTDNENIGTRIIVALAKLNVKSEKKNYQLERGKIAVFLYNESYEEPNGEFFEIGLKKDHPQYKSPAQWIEPEKNIVIYEDDQFRVFEERLAAGDDRQLHSHAQRLVVRLNLVQLTDPRLHDTAKPGSGIQVPNTVKFAEPIIHAVRNLSKIPLFNIVIEFKVPH